MASKYSIEAVFKAVDDFTAPLKKMQNQNSKFANALKSDFAKAQRSVQQFANKLKSAIKGIGVGLTVGAGLLGAGLIKVGKDAIQLASDLDEVQNVVDVTFQKDAEKINAWSKTTLKAFGLSELQAKRFSSTLGAMMKSSGLAGDKIARMGMDLSELAGDMASFYNLDIEEAFSKIRGGLSGETEPLKVLGVDMSITNLQKTFGLDSKQWQSLDASQKMILRYKYLMKVTKDAQGDFTRTMSDSLANQQRVLKTTIEQMLATLGSVFMPAIVKFSNEALKIIQGIDIESIKQKLEDFVNNIDFDKLINDIKNLAVQFFNWTKSAIKLISTLKPFLPLIISIIAAFKIYHAVLLVVSAAQSIFNAITTANPIGIVILAIGVLIGLIILLVKNWDKVKAAVISFVQNAYNFLMNLFNKIFECMDGLPLFAQLFTTPFRIAIDLVRTLLQGWKAVISAFTENGIKEGIMQIGKTILAFLITPLKNALGLISKIPGVGNLTKGASTGLNNFHSSLITPTTKEERATVVQRTENTTRGIVEIRDTTGKATMTRPIKSDNPQIKFSSSGGF